MVLKNCTAHVNVLIKNLKNIDPSKRKNLMQINTRYCSNTNHKALVGQTLYIMIQKSQNPTSESKECMHDQIVSKGVYAFFISSVSKGKRVPIVNSASKRKDYRKKLHYLGSISEERIRCQNQIAITTTNFIFNCLNLHPLF